MFSLGCYRGLISLFLILGVLLITRPPFIFGPDGVPQKNSLQQTLTPFLPDELQPGQHHFHPLNLSNTNTKTKTELHKSWVGFHWSPIAFGTILHKTYEEHMKLYHYHFTSKETLIGYIACVAVPLLSAVISLITRQCNNQKVPIYVLMFWFGVGATCVMIGGK